MDLTEIYNEVKWHSYYTALNYRYRLVHTSRASQFQPNPYSVLNEMKKAQWTQEKSLSKKIHKRVKTIVNHAYRHVPYYNRLCKTLGLYPDQLSTLRDFEKFPVMTKEELREAGREMLADNTDIAHPHATSGSTGTPLTFYLDSNWGLRRFAAKWLLDSYFGARPQTRYFAITINPPHDTNIHKPTSFQDRLHDFTNKLANSELVNPYQNYLFSRLEITKEKFPKIAQELIRFKPKYGSVTPTQLQLISEIIPDLPTPFPKLQAMICGTENLLDSERKRFEQIFGCHIFNRYGSAEFWGAVAGECKYHLGMHVNLDLVLVEVVDDNNTPCSSGEVGNIVITDFWNRSMPFIRYKLGDIGSLESNCTCGRTFPMLGKVIGRANELVMNKYGIKVPVISLYVSEELAEHVLNFQFKQTKPGHLTMFIVPRKGWNEYVAKERMIKIGRLNGIDFEFEIVDKVTSFPSGKRRLLV